MQVNYGIRNYYSGNVSFSYNYSWYANSTTHRINSQFSPLSTTDYYEIWAELRDTNGTQIDSDTLQIQVINQTNNSGGNNSSGGNNTGGNSTTSDAHCLELANLSINQTYYVTLNLVNTCSFSINYPGINASADNSNVQGLYDGWWYQMVGQILVMQSSFILHN